LADDFAIPPLEYYRGMWPSAFGWLCRFLTEARLGPKSEIQARRARHFIQTVGPRIRSEVWARFSRNLDGKLSCSAKDGREFCGKKPGFLQTNGREWPGTCPQKLENFCANIENGFGCGRFWLIISDSAAGGLPGNLWLFFR
jgi:hypothetical protein